MTISYVIFGLRLNIALLGVHASKGNRSQDLATIGSCYPCQKLMTFIPWYIFHGYNANLHIHTKTSMQRNSYVYNNVIFGYISFWLHGKCRLRRMLL